MPHRSTPTGWPEHYRRVRSSPDGGTGRRRGLKPPSPLGHVGSSPTPGTVVFTGACGWRAMPPQGHRGDTWPVVSASVTRSEFTTSPRHSPSRSPAYRVPRLRPASVSPQPRRTRLQSGTSEVDRVCSGSKGRSKAVTLRLVPRLPRLACRRTGSCSRSGSATSSEAVTSSAWSKRSPKWLTKRTSKWLTTGFALRNHCSPRLRMRRTRRLRQRGSFYCYVIFPP